MTSFMDSSAALQAASLASMALIYLFIPLFWAMNLLPLPLVFLIAGSPLLNISFLDSWRHRSWKANKRSCFHFIFVPSRVLREDGKHLTLDMCPCLVFWPEGPSHLLALFGCSGSQASAAASCPAVDCRSCWVGSSWSFCLSWVCHDHVLVMHILCTICVALLVTSEVQDTEELSWHPRMYNPEACGSRCSREHKSDQQHTGWRWALLCFSAPSPKAGLQRQENHMASGKTSY